MLLPQQCILFFQLQRSLLFILRRLLYKPQLRDRVNGVGVKVVLSAASLVEIIAAAIINAALFITLLSNSIV